MKLRNIVLFEAFQEAVLIHCKQMRFANLRLSGLNFRFISNMKEGKPHLFLKLVFYCYENFNASFI